MRRSDRKKNFKNANLAMEIHQNKVRNAKIVESEAPKEIISFDLHNAINESLQKMNTPKEVVVQDVRSEYKKGVDTSTSLIERIRNFKPTVVEGVDCPEEGSYVTSEGFDLNTAIDEQLAEAEENDESEELDESEEE